MNALRQLVILAPVMWFLSRRMGMSGIWWAFPVTETATVLLSWLLHRRSSVILE